MNNQTYRAILIVLMILAFSQTILVQTSLAAIRSSEIELAVDKARFQIIIEPGRLQVTKEDISSYVRDAARAVISYYGTFPVTYTVVRVSPSDDDGVGFASSTHDDENECGSIEIDIGHNATREDLETSWTMTHEMMHLAFPIMGNKHRWLAEGISTYIEPIGRMRIGKISREKMWGDLARNIRKGLPGTDGSGLNEVRSYGRMYWGGALYCLLADIEIRKQTDNRMGLEQALRAIARSGGTAASNWSAMKALETGDEALGVTVLEDLYEQMALRPKSVNIAQLLDALGIKRDSGRTYLTDRAPLSKIRHAIEDPFRHF
ncbi:MAG: hypothetical protein K2Z81_07950 [Cyanobacteria bacterium]|nr:hypothetical protein [Cyanobacteriota bacterium]